MESIQINASAMERPETFLNSNPSILDCYDISNYSEIYSESIKRRFGWETIDRCNLPFITRVIGGQHVRYISLKIVESKLLCNYLKYLHDDIYKFTPMRSNLIHLITKPEASLLNEINMNHSDQMYGEYLFRDGIDYIVRVEDVREFYAFVEFCYFKLLGNISPGHNDKCGFICINSTSFVPYCVKNDQKYVPIFYFEGKIESLKRDVIRLEDWSLAYLKFCCKLQGISDKFFASDSCIVTSIINVKNHFPLDAIFDEFWPSKIVDTHLLINQNFTHVSSPRVWIREPPASTNTRKRKIGFFRKFNQYQNDLWFHQGLETFQQNTSSMNNHFSHIAPQLPSTPSLPLILPPIGWI